MITQYINRFRTWLGWKILPPSSYTTIAKEVLEDGFFAHEAKRLSEFIKDEEKKLKTSPASSKSNYNIGMAEGWFKFIYGKEVKFELVDGGVAKHLYTSSNFILDRISKIDDFVGKEISVLPIPFKRKYK